MLIIRVLYKLTHRLIRSSKCLLEVDFEDNLIGDLGGHEIMEALQGRKEGEYQPLSLLALSILFTGDVG